MQITSNVDQFSKQDLIDFLSKLGAHENKCNFDIPRTCFILPHNFLLISTKTLSSQFSLLEQFVQFAILYFLTAIFNYISCLIGSTLHSIHLLCCLMSVPSFFWRIFMKGKSAFNNLSSSCRAASVLLQRTISLSMNVTVILHCKKWLHKY